MKLTRFITKSTAVSRPAPPEYRVKKEALMPRQNPNTQTWELSVLDSTELSETEMKLAGATLFSNSTTQPKGHIEFPEKILGDHSLHFTKDGIDHKEHGNVLGWPFLDGEVVNKAKDLADGLTEESCKKIVLY